LSLHITLIQTPLSSALSSAGPLSGPPALITTLKRGPEPTSDNDEPLPKRRSDSVTAIGEPASELQLQLNEHLLAIRFAMHRIEAIVIGAAASTLPIDVSERFTSAIAAYASAAVIIATTGNSIAITTTAEDVAGGDSHTTTTTGGFAAAAIVTTTAAPTIPVVATPFTAQPASVYPPPPSNLQSLIERYNNSSTDAEHKAILDEVALPKLSIKDRSIFFEGVTEKGGRIVAALAERSRQTIGTGKQGRRERKEIRKQIRRFDLGVSFKRALRQDRSLRRSETERKAM
jgi:hypothetical protein